MKAYCVSSPDGIDAITVEDRPLPEPGPNEIRVRMEASSLNYRDLLVSMGGYPGSDVRPIVPLSDGAGVVDAVGSEVSAFKPGDRVAGCFFQNWEDGRMTAATAASALGGGLDGVLAEYALFRERGAVKIPDYMDFAQAATLPCAALTAWHALQRGGLRAGDRVLLLGTGGVSMFGLQLAKAAGAEVIVTSSSDAKLEKARALGADHVINYRDTPDWDRRVLEITGGEGVSNVLEIGGAGTLEKSIRSTGLHGSISLIGIVAGGDMPMSLAPALKMQDIHGVYVGSQAMFRDMNRALELHRIQPVIDRTFAFDQALDAYRYLQGAAHVGKVVISHSA